MSYNFYKFSLKFHFLIILPSSIWYTVSDLYIYLISVSLIVEHMMIYLALLLYTPFLSDLLGWILLSSLQVWFLPVNVSLIPFCQPSNFTPFPYIKMGAAIILFQLYWLRFYEYFLISADTFFCVQYHFHICNKYRVLEN